MRGARGRALVIAFIAVVAVAALGVAAIRRGPQPQPPAERPTLLLLTSLPLLFNEDFSLQGGGSAALKALQSHYRVVPISVTNARDLSKGRILLMAQPLAQTAENLVALDDWVRKGGRVLLLADPLLEWSSKRPLGDALRPPPMFSDTGLLGHWGLRLDAPDQRGWVISGGGHNPVAYISPGRLATSRRGCVLSRADIVAECKIGRGRVIVVADADFLNPAIGTLQNPTIDNTRELMELLDTLSPES